MFVEYHLQLHKKHISLWCARKQCSLSYPRIFKGSVKMHLTSRRTFAWDFSCSFNPKKKRIFLLTLFSLILRTPFLPEANRLRIRVLRIEVPLTPSKLITVSILFKNVLLTQWQTNTQTNLFNLVRSSFQSREPLLVEKIGNKKFYNFCCVQWRNDLLIFRFHLDRSH